MENLTWLCRGKGLDKVCIQFLTGPRKNKGSGSRALLGYVKGPIFCSPRSLCLLLVFIILFWPSIGLGEGTRSQSSWGSMLSL